MKVKKILLIFIHFYYNVCAHIGSIQDPEVLKFTNYVNGFTDITITHLDFLKYILELKGYFLRYNLNLMIFYSEFSKISELDPLTKGQLISQFG